MSMPSHVVQGINIYISSPLSISLAKFVELL